MRTQRKLTPEKFQKEFTAYSTFFDAYMIITYVALFIAILPVLIGLICTFL
jgi:hypothetical protein